MFFFSSRFQTWLTDPPSQWRICVSPEAICTPTGTCTQKELEPSSSRSGRHALYIHIQFIQQGTFGSLIQNVTSKCGRGQWRYSQPQRRVMRGYQHSAILNVFQNRWSSCRLYVFCPCRWLRTSTKTTTTCGWSTNQTTPRVRPRASWTGSLSTFSFTFRAFGRRFYPNDLQSVHLSEERETTIYRCRYSKDVQRTKCQALTIPRLTHSP